MPKITRDLDGVFEALAILDARLSRAEATATALQVFFLRLGSSDDNFPITREVWERSAAEVSDVLQALIAEKDDVEDDAAVAIWKNAAEIAEAFGKPNPRTPFEPVVIQGGREDHPS